MPRTLFAAALALVLAVATDVTASAQEAIGAVSRIQGEASTMRGSATEALALDSAVFLNDVVTTGAAARLEVAFVDGTKLTLGAKTRLTLDRFIYAPGSGVGSLRFGVVGAFRFVSGRITKLANANAVIVTPTATAGIRGTDFWGGPIDDQALGMVLFEGAIVVSNAAGQQVLETPGQGTNIAQPGDAPGPVTFWPQDKVDRAVATVTFQ